MAHVSIPMSILFMPGDPFVFIDENLRPIWSVIIGTNDESGSVGMFANSVDECILMANALMQFRRQDEVQIGNIIYRPN